MVVEKELKIFFFIIANNPVYYSPDYQSILNMTEPYIKGLKEIPKTSKYYHYSRGIIEGLYVKTGRLKNDLWLKDDYKPGVSYYEDKELNSFYMRRRAFIEILEQITSGLPLSEIEALGTIGIRASELQPATYFEISGGKMKTVEYPSGADVTSNKIGGYKELIGITRLGFLSLTLFLANTKGGGKDRIKKCPICNKFFPAKDTKRKICYEKKCINKYHKDDMKKRRDINPVKYC